MYVGDFQVLVLHLDVIMKAQGILSVICLEFQDVIGGKPVGDAGVEILECVAESMLCSVVPDVYHGEYRKGDGIEPASS